MSTLSTSAILEGMANALPTHPPGDTGSDLASSYEAIALLIHAYLSALNFRLIGFNEGQPLAECQSLAPRLPASWNAGYGSLSFVYKHKQSAMDFVFRIDRMGAKVEVRGLAVGADSIYRFERTVRDVVQANNLPVRIKLVPSSSSSSSSSEGNDGAPPQQQQEEDRSDLPNQLRAVFVSDQAIANILNDLKVKIVQKLIPKLQQQGYVETTTDAEAEETARSERRQQEARDPNRPFRGDPRPPHAPYPEPGPLPEMARPRPGAPSADFPPPGFDDEYDIHRPPPHGAGGLVMPGRSPYNIGHDDLHPPGLGPHDPLRPSFGGGGLAQPGSSGMHPTFDDPLFAGQGGRGDGFGGGRGGDGYDPQAPPGARWDPLGPGGGPRFPGPGGNNPFGGDII